MSTHKVDTIHPAVQDAIVANLETDDHIDLITHAILTHNSVLDKCNTMLTLYGKVSPTIKKIATQALGRLYMLNNLLFPLDPGLTYIEKPSTSNPDSIQYIVPIEEKNFDVILNLDRRLQENMRQLLAEEAIKSGMVGAGRSRSRSRKQKRRSTRRSLRK
jgi:hypothetical protein